MTRASPFDPSVPDSANYSRGVEYEINDQTNREHWTEIGTAGPGEGGNYDFEDTNADNATSRYYRVETRERSILVGRGSHGPISSAESCGWEASFRCSGLQPPRSIRLRPASAWARCSEWARRWASRRGFLAGSACYPRNLASSTTMGWRAAGAAAIHLRPQPVGHPEQGRSPPRRGRMGGEWSAGCWRG